MGTEFYHKRRITLRILAFLVPVLLLFTLNASASDYPESLHPYKAQQDVTYTYTLDSDAYGMNVTFSELTELQSSDRLVISGSDGVKQIFYEKELAGRTVFVPGNTLTILLDGYLHYVNHYGFAVTDITAFATEADYKAWVEAHPFSVNASGMLISYNASDAEVVVPEVIDGITVTKVADGAFRERTDITSIALPDTVTEIGSSAFTSCSALTKADLGDGLLAIGEDAFIYCRALAEVDFGSSLVSLGNYSFCDCNALNGIVLPDTLTSIGRMSFFSCSSLTEIDIPSAVASLKDYVFEGCTSLTRVGLSEGLTSIGNYAFSGCTSLTEIVIPESVATAGTYLFEDCTSLVRAQIPSNWTALPNSIFCGCSKLTQVNIPQNLSSVGSLAFSGCAGLTEIVLPDSVTTIGSSAFRDCTGLTSFSIPAAVTSIGSSAFEGCTGLGSINIPDGITAINSSMFKGCTGLTELNLPDSITSIGSYAFNGCTALTKLNIPSKVTSIGISAFNNCQSLTGIDLPAGLTSLGSSAFCECISITKAVIPSGVTSIPSYAFENCIGLQQLTLPEGLTSIGYRSFYNCQSLTEVKLPSTLTSINTFAFYSCMALQKIAIPEGIKTIPESAFEGCLELTEVSLPSTLTTIDDYAFFYCIKLPEIKIPEGVTTIGDYAFRGCQSFEQITLPDSITSLGSPFLPDGVVIRFGTNEVIKEYAIKYGHEYFSDDGSLDIPDFTDAHEKVTWIVENYTADCESEYDIALALYDWVCANVAYDYYYLSTMTPTSPLGVGGNAAILDGTAVCQGFAQAYMWLLEEAGIEAVYVRGFGNNDDHGWNIAKIDGEWYQFDATWDEAGNGDTHNYFALTDQAMRADHDQYTHLHLVCDSWDANYFYRTGQLDTALASLRAAIENCISTGVYSDTIDASSTAAYPINSEAMAQLVAMIVSHDTDWSIAGYADVTAGIYRDFTFTFHPDKAPVTSIAVEGADPDDVSDAYSMLVGDTLQMNVSTVPANGKVTFTSSDESVLTVSETGLVTAVADGYSDLMLTSGNASIGFRIYVQAAGRLQIFGPSNVENQYTTQVEAEIGDTFETFISGYYPPFLQSDSITWASSDESVAKVDATGKVTIVGGGRANITATTASGLRSSYTITVLNPIVTGVVFGQEVYQGYIGQKLRLDVHVEGCDQDEYKDNYYNLTYSVSDSTIAECNLFSMTEWNEEGQYWVYTPVVVGKQTGEVTITATAKDGSGASATCKVIIIEPPYLDSVTFDAPVFTGNAGEKISLSLHVSEEDDAFYKENYGSFNYSSSNTDVAAHANSVRISWESSTGLWRYQPYVNCIAPGVTVFTATAVDGSGVSDSAAVIVHYNSKLILPAGTKTIESEAFCGVAAEEILIPEGAEVIEAKAFRDCNNLKLVLLPASLESIDSTAFDGCSENMTLVVYAGTPGETFAKTQSFNTVIIPD